MHILTTCISLIYPKVYQLSESRPILHLGSDPVKLFAR